MQYVESITGVGALPDILLFSDKVPISCFGIAMTL